MRLYIFLVTFICIPGILMAQPKISEIQSFNKATIQDARWEYPDWIELHNPSSESVDLTGWSLSDNPTNPLKWEIPNITIPAGGYQLFFASGKDVESFNWITVVEQGDSARYLVPGPTTSKTWMEFDFDDSGWAKGKSGFGFGNGDDATVLSGNPISVYTRFEFNITDTNIVNMALHIDFDDSFVAYLNGVEVIRENIHFHNDIQGVAWDKQADGVRSPQMASGGSPEFFDIKDKIRYIRKGKNVLAIEVHDRSSSRSLSLIPFLSIAGENAQGSVSSHTGLSNLGIPHTNFKIGTNGESFVLSDPSGKKIDELEMPNVPAGYSYGQLNGSTDYGMFLNPTPGQANGSSESLLLENDLVTFSVNGGYVIIGRKIELSSNNSSDKIRYTTDGSEPTLNSTLFSKGIPIYTSTVIKGAIFNDGYLTGKTFTRTFWTTDRHKLPVVCLSTEPDNLWNDETGMYEWGDAHAWYDANYMQDWERPFHVEYYDTTGVIRIDQLAGGKLFGSYSRKRPQKSFSLHAKKTYGTNKFEYPFFHDKPISEFNSFLLRNSGGDFCNAHILDGIVTEVGAPMDLDRQAFQPTVTYLNGKYWGIYNMREKINEHYLSNNHHVDPDDVDLLESDAEIVEGDNADYLDLKHFLTINENLSNTSLADELDSQVDINEFINYQSIQMFVANWDWPGKNIKFWKEDKESPKFRWILYDTDFAFGTNGGTENYTWNMLDFALDPDGPSKPDGEKLDLVWPNPPYSTLLFRRLITSEKFRHKFINHYADHLNLTFKPERISFIVDSIKNLTREEMSYHFKKWEKDFNRWEPRLNEIKQWANRRPAYVRSHIQSRFELETQETINCNVKSIGGGKIRINSIVPQSYPFEGIYFHDVPIELEAVPAVGYRFVKWEGDVVSTNRIIAYDMSEGVSFTAVFEPFSTGAENLVINEINYNSSDILNTGDWVEIYNNGNAHMDLSGFILSDADTSKKFTLPEGVSISAGGYLIVARKSDDMEFIYPDLVDKIIGDLEFGLNSTADIISLYDEEMRLLDQVSYTSFSPWPTDANGTGATIQLIAANLDNSKGVNWNTGSDGGTPGAISSTTSIDVTPSISQAEPSKVTAFPTRFTDYTTIEISTYKQAKLNIEVYNLSGKSIEILADDIIDFGNYTIDWQPAQSLTPGIYLIKCAIGGEVKTMKVIYQ